LVTSCYESSSGRREGGSGDDDVDVEDRLSNQRRNAGAADVVDSERWNVREDLGELEMGLLEVKGPLRIVLLEDYFHPG
jgi:hypothetical protein